jgi:hypothetical protein
MELQTIADFLDIDIKEIKELTKEQKSYLSSQTSNLWQMPKYYTDDFIIFTTESAMKHWQYYAGFEYCDDPETMKRNGEFIAAYSADEERVNDYLEMIKENETN